MPTTDNQWAEALTQVLERAVRRHLDSDANIGCMLSGGMDSSSLAVVAADQVAAAGRPPLATFSSIDSDPADAETRAIRAMLTLPGFNPTLIDPAAIDAMRAELVEAAWQSDEPFDPSMILLHAQYLAASRSGVDAVIDGIDGDALFAAGNSLVRQLRQLQWHSVWRNIQGLQRLYPDWNAWGHLLSQCRGAFIPEGLRGNRRGPNTLTAIQSSLISPEFAQHVDLRKRLDQLNSWRAAYVPRDAATQATQSLAHPHTTCCIERYHRVAAWHGVDPRHPLADRGVLELGVNFPDAQRLADGRNKAVLRRAMRTRLPMPVRCRTDKQHLGWNLIHRLLLDDQATILQQVAEFQRVLAPYVDASKLTTTVQRWHQTREKTAGVTLLEALSLGAWLSRQSGAPERASRAHPYEYPTLQSEHNTAANR